MREGIVRYDAKHQECYVIWNDNPCRPEIFPFIAKRVIRTQTPILFQIQSNRDNTEYTLFTTDTNERDFFWAGIQKLHIKTQKSVVLTDDMIAKSRRFNTKAMSMIRSPIEVSVQDTKNITICKDTKEHSPFETKVVWDSQKSVIRDCKTKHIYTVPNWIIWKDLVALTKDTEMNAQMKWNTHLQKYQVNTVSKIL